MINKNVITLAYIGDAVYEIYIRKYLLEKGISKVNTLQKEAIKYVSAKNQSKYLEKILDKNILDEKEIELIHRARNNKGVSHPKNTDIITYKWATALESLIGYLYLDNQKERLDKIMEIIIGE